MTFDHPAGFLWGAAAAIVVLLYITWRRRRIVSATTTLWRRAFARRTLWQRLRRPVSLLLQLLVVALVVAALAEPRLDDRALWLYLVAAAGFLLVLEWFLFHRRATV